MVPAMRANYVNEVTAEVYAAVIKASKVSTGKISAIHPHGVTLALLRTAAIFLAMSKDSDSPEKRDQITAEAKKTLDKLLAEERVKMDAGKMPVIPVHFEQAPGIN